MVFLSLESSLLPVLCPSTFYFFWLYSHFYVVPLFVHTQSLSRIQLFATPWTVAQQTLLSVGFPRQEYWSGLPFPPPGYLSYPEIKLASPVLAGRFFTTEPPGKALLYNTDILFCNDHSKITFDWNVAGRGGPFQGMRVGLCLTLVSELSKETQELTKQETLLRTDIQVENRRIREPRKTALPRDSHLGFYSNGVGFWVVSGQSFGFRVLPAVACITQPR